MMKKQSNCLITENTESTPGTMRLTAVEPEIAAAARPGQFVNVLCGPCMDPLLRRPFSIYTVDKARGEFSLLYQVRGRGTTLLSRKRPGELLDVVGPIGRPFEIDPAENIEHILVGGGCGVAPLVFLSDAIREEAQGRITTLIGARTADAVLCRQEFAERGLPVALSTDDGTAGRRGLVTDLLAEHLERLGPGIQPRIYACGPQDMLKEVARVSAAGKVNHQPPTIPCQISLETAMACGIGVCMGCVVKTRDPAAPEGWAYKRVCVDGPVFYATELFWE